MIMNSLVVFVLISNTISLLANYTATLSETSAPEALWQSISSSSSGQYLAAVSSPGLIYISYNYGYDWLPSDAKSLNWHSVACDSTGQFVSAVCEGGGIFSSINYGLNWTKTSAPTADWSSIASDSAGLNLVAGIRSGGVYFSNNSGTSWYPSDAQSLDWYAMCMSSSGQYAASAVYGTGVYISNNYGQSFNVTSAVRGQYNGIACSSSGQFIAAVVLSGGVYTSNDYGVTWVLTEAPYNVAWYAIASDSTGQYLTAVIFIGGIYASSDYGVSWYLTESPSVSWVAVTASASNQYIAAVVKKGLIYTSQYAPSSFPSSSPTAVPSTSRPSGRPSSSPSTMPSSRPTVFQKYSTTLIATSAQYNAWEYITSSSTGQFLAAVTEEGSIYTSDNYGYNWYPTTAPNNLWIGIAANQSGSQLCAVVKEGGVYLSSDFGATWALTSAPNASGWQTVASDASGVHLFAGIRVGAMYYSNNSGVTWYVSDAPKEAGWYGLAVSSSGQYAAAIIYNGAVYTSVDYGASFNKTSSGRQEWCAIASSCDGQLLYATVFNGGIWMSNNFGETWSQCAEAPNAAWQAISCDCTGQYLMAVIYGGGVYSSSYFGTQWQLTQSPVEGWVSITSSDSGEFVAAVVNGGGIYSNQYSPTSQPSSSPSMVPSSQPTKSPTTQPTSQPSNQPHTSFPSSQPSSCPSGLPTTQPLAFPTAAPSAYPSSQPSNQPTTYPTYVPDTWQVNEVVESDKDTSSVVFNNLGCGSVVYLTATIEVSYLSQSSNGWLNITAGNGTNTLIVASSCAPQDTCGTIVCAVNTDVTRVVSCEGGGSLMVTANTVNANQESGLQSICTYKGTNDLKFAVSYTVSANPLPTMAPTPVPTVPGKSNFVFQASPNAPFYVIVIMSLLLAALGVLIVRLRDTSLEFAAMRLTLTCLDMSLIGYHLMSEFFYILVLWNQNGRATRLLASLIITIRLCSLFPSSYFLLITLGPEKYSAPYKTMFNSQHFFQFATTYSAVMFVMMFEQSMVRYFPWNASEYTFLSRGFPDQHVFQVVMFSKLLQLVLTLVIQIVVLTYSDSYLFHNGGDTIELVLVLLYLSSSVTAILIFSMTNCIRMRMGSTALEHQPSMSIEEGVKNSIHRGHSVDGTELVGRHGSEEGNVSDAYVVGRPTSTRSRSSSMLNVRPASAVIGSLSLQQARLQKLEESQALLLRQVSGIAEEVKDLKPAEKSSNAVAPAIQVIQD